MIIVSAFQIGRLAIKVVTIILLLKASSLVRNGSRESWNGLKCYMRDGSRLIESKSVSDICSGIATSVMIGNGWKNEYVGTVHDFDRAMNIEEKRFRDIPTHLNFDEVEVTSFYKTGYYDSFPHFLVVHILMFMLQDKRIASFCFKLFSEEDILRKRLERIKIMARMRLEWATREYILRQLHAFNLLGLHFLILEICNLLMVLFHLGIIQFYTWNSHFGDKNEFEFQVTAFRGEEKRLMNFTGSNSEAFPVLLTCGFRLDGGNSTLPNAFQTLCVHPKNHTNEQFYYHFYGWVQCICIVQLLRCLRYFYAFMSQFFPKERRTNRVGAVSIRRVTYPPLQTGQLADYPYVSIFLKRMKDESVDREVLRVLHRVLGI